MIDRPLRMRGPYYRVRSLEQVRENPEDNMEDYLDFLLRVVEREDKEKYLERMRDYCLVAIELPVNKTEYNSFFDIQDLITADYKDNKIDITTYREMKDIMDQDKIEFRKNIYSYFNRELELR